MLTPSLPLFQQRWADVLALRPATRRAAFTYEELRPRVDAAFPASGPGWSHARYHSPDVMIAAISPEAIARGEFHLVVGEVHLGVNSLNGSLFVGQHPHPQEIYDAIVADFAEPRIVPVPAAYKPERIIVDRTVLLQQSLHRLKLVVLQKIFWPQLVELKSHLLTQYLV